MHIERRSIDSIIPYDTNPRLNDAAVEAVAHELTPEQAKAYRIADNRAEHPTIDPSITRIPLSQQPLTTNPFGSSQTT
ncbi:MAG TPA: hypothetical protein VHC70_00070 [Phycisphaerales bacterium]|nr:hypothetical protein [Phycisphaerales bacterium]